MVDFGGPVFEEKSACGYATATVEDSLVKYLKFEPARVALSFDFSFLHFDVL
jgi:hypothetical protein